jgi:hypothetical protein
MPTLTETIELLRAERKALATVRGWGRLNEKLARYYEVRTVALETLARHLFSPQQ